MPRDLLIAGELILFGTVGDDFFNDGFTAYDVLQALAEHGRSKDLTVRLNSGGGLIDEGKAIYNALKAHRGDVEMSVEGIAASSASVIAMAGDTIIMKQGALMMIHEPHVLTLGNLDDHQRSVEMLKNEIEVMADIYAERSGASVKVVKQQMKAETWFDGAAAVEAGYCDTAEKSAKAAVAAAFPYRQLYSHAPSRLLALADRRGWSKAKFGKGTKMGNKPVSADPKPKPDDEDDPDTSPPPPPPEPVDSPNPPMQTLIADAADPAAIIDRCVAAGVPELASQLVRAKASLAKVDQRIEDAKRIKQSVATFRKTYPSLSASLGNELIAGGASFDEARAEMFNRIEAIAAMQPTSTAQPTQAPRAAEEGFGEDEVKAAWDKQLKRINARFRTQQGGFYAAGIPENVGGGGKRS